MRASNMLVMKETVLVATCAIAVHLIPLAAVELSDAITCGFPARIQEIITPDADEKIGIARNGAAAAFMGTEQRRLPDALIRSRKRLLRRHVGSGDFVLSAQRQTRPKSRRSPYDAASDGFDHVRNVGSRKLWRYR
jgi:hypothetical protein